MPIEGFQVNVEKAVGHKFEAEKVRCNRRDYLLYALGIGVSADELCYLYENDKNFGPLPTYPLVLILKGDDYDVNVFKKRAQAGGPLPGMPHYDPNKIVHGEQSLEVITPFPKMGGRFTSQKTCTGVYDKGSGMVVEVAMDIYSEEGNIHYCHMVSKTFVRGYGGWGGPKGPTTIQHAPPARAPDVIDIFATDPNQALLYRLSGDFNPLHADIDLAPKIGFPKPILHGLSSYGACAHAIIRHFGNNDRLRFKSITARFASPVYPGDTVEILLWKTDTPDAKTDAITFIAKVKERDVVVISNGYATLTKEAQSSKL